MKERRHFQRALLALVILGLAAIEPLTHVWIRYFPPEGTVPTGMHIGDSAHHLLCMRSFLNGFHSPFASCKAPAGANSWHYFATPFFLLYGLMGAAGHALQVNEFLFLGILNGLGGALYLLTAYRLLREIAPKLAHTAFYCFALGGGLGGGLYVLTGLLGLHTHPDFQHGFERFAWYELIEGQHLSPALLMPRFYYTLPLALGLAALTALLQAERRRSTKHLVLAGCLAFLTAALNLRLGPMFWLVALLYLSAASPRPFRERLCLALTFGAPAALGGLMFWGVLQQHPSYGGNVARITQQAMRLIPFLSATLLFWIAAGRGVWAALPTLPRSFQFLAWTCAGYLGLYGLAYLGYQAYFGNWLYGGDTSAAIAASDPALLGALGGGIAGVAFRWRSSVSGRILSASNESTGTANTSLGWVALWLLCFLAVALSAFGQGWFLRFSPQRFMVLLGLPLALLTADGLWRMRPALRRVLFTLIIGCGFVSLGVASLCFQGVLGRTPGQGPFAHLHYALMTENDAALLKQEPKGTTLVPMWSPIAFGEVLSLREGVNVLGGPGALNLGDQVFGPVEQAVNAFFSPDIGDDFRLDLLNKWCVDFVYCPDTCPVAEVLLDHFETVPWLTERLRAGKGRLFGVARDTLPGRPIAGLRGAQEDPR